MTDGKPIIYIVDDDPSIGRALGRLLKSLGYNSIGFSSAEAFLEGADLKEGDCLVLDILLPGMDGPELQRELKKRKNNIPIIFITGHGEKQLENEVMSAGAHGYLNKPFDEHVLVNLIDEALKSAHTAHINRESKSL